MIPSSLISRQAQSLLQYYPLQNFTGSTAYNYQIPTISNTHTDTLQVRTGASLQAPQFPVGRVCDAGHPRRPGSGLQFPRSEPFVRNAGHGDLPPHLYAALLRNFHLSVQPAASPGSFPTSQTSRTFRAMPESPGNNQEPLNWGPPSLGFQQSTITGLNDQTPALQEPDQRLSAIWARGITGGTTFSSAAISAGSSSTFSAEQSARQPLPLPGRRARERVTISPTFCSACRIRVPSPSATRISICAPCSPICFSRTTGKSARLLSHPGFPLGIHVAGYGKVRAPGQPGCRARLYRGGAGGGQRSHGTAHEHDLSVIADSPG